MNERTRAGIAILAAVILWRGAAVMPDGRVAGTIAPSPATAAGLKVNDYIKIIDGRSFEHDRLTDAAKVIIIDRAGEMIPILNPRTRYY